MKELTNEQRLVAALADAHKIIEQHFKTIAELERFKAAYEEWHEKTEWVQETATYKELGKHRADVLRERIAELEKDAARENVLEEELRLVLEWAKTEKKPLRAQEIKSIERALAFDTAMQKD